MKEVGVLLSMYAPITAFVIVVWYIILRKKIEETSIRVPLGPLSFTIPIKNSGFAKVIIISFVTVLLSAFYVLYDFSGVYPNEMRMAVFFNEVDGINKLIDELNIDSVNGIPIDKDNDTDRIAYFVDGDTIIENYLNYDKYYSDAVVNGNCVLESEGSVSFIVKKIAGLQTYEISESIGELNHTRYLKKDEGIQELHSKFYKTRSPNDKIRISNWSEFFSGVVIAPKFNQALVVNGKNEELLDHDLYGVSKLYPFPYPTYSRTLYLYKHKGVLIPIGYCEYYED